MTSKTYFH